MKLVDAECGNIYRVRSELSQWNNVIILFKRADNTNFIIEVLTSSHIIVGIGDRIVNKGSVVGRSAIIELLGNEENMPEYFL